MHLVPRNLYPDYQDMDACEVLIDCIAYLGTKYLLDKNTFHIPIAGE